MSKEAVQVRREEEGLQSRRDAPVGGQAVLEGVMMRGVSTWAVAVRKPAPEQLAGGRILERGAVPRGPIHPVSEPLVSGMRVAGRVLPVPGPEQKPNSCFGAGLPRTPDNAQRFSRPHPRCGTSFLLIVMVVAIVAFAPLGTPAWYILFPSRVVGIPLVAGLAFELIKLFGKKRDKRWAQILMAPGMQLQKLTTREPDLSQLEVAIAALQAVLAVENPDQASEEERVGMEVVA